MGVCEGDHSSRICVDSLVFQPSVWAAVAVTCPPFWPIVLLFKGQGRSHASVCVCVCDCVKERMREAECLIKIVAVLLKLLNNSVLHRRLW